MLSRFGHGALCTGTVLLWAMDALAAWTLSRFGHGALDNRTYWYSVAVGNGRTGSMDVIKVRAWRNVRGRLKWPERIFTIRGRGDATTSCDGEAKRQHGTWRPHHAKERRSDNMARGGLDELELKSLGKHGRDGVDTDGKPAATRVVVGLNPEP